MHYFALEGTVSSKYDHGFSHWVANVTEGVDIEDEVDDSDILQLEPTE